MRREWRRVCKSVCVCASSIYGCKRVVTVTSDRANNACKLRAWQPQKLNKQRQQLKLSRAWLIGKVRTHLSLATHATGGGRRGGEESRLLTLIRSTNDRQGNGGKQNKRPKAKSCKWSHFKYRNASIEGNRCRSAARKKTVLKTPTTTAVEKYQKIWNHSLMYLMRGNCCRPRHLISWEQIRCDGRLLEPTTSWTEIDPTC